jgi:GxxExxY protein
MSERSIPNAMDGADPLTARIIGAAITVHKALGPGLLESAYHSCLKFELASEGLSVDSEVPVPLDYRGHRLDCGYRIDLLVERRVIVEVKAVERLQPIHEAQLLTYLRLAGKSIGLLLNFNSPYLRDGIKRMVL